MNLFQQTQIKHLYLYSNQLQSLHAGQLQPLPDLQTVKLNGNQLEVLPSGFFANLPKLSTVTVYDNPWRCDCSSSYMRGWVRDHGQLVKGRGLKSGGAVMCDSPTQVRGLPMANLTDADFSHC